MAKPEFCCLSWRPSSPLLQAFWGALAMRFRVERALLLVSLCAPAAPSFARSTAALQPDSPSRRADQRNELTLCAQFSLQYEAPYLLPFVAYNTLAGVDRIFLYHDDASAAYDPRFARDHAPLLALLRASSAVTLISMRAAGLSKQQDAIRHCNFYASRTSAWVANWDLDEVPVLPPNRSLTSFLGSLPEHVSGVLLPRLCMTRNETNLDLPPTDLLEYEAYTQPFKLDVLSKPIWRGCATGSAASCGTMAWQGAGIHQIVVQTTSAATVIYPDGRAAARCACEQASSCARPDGSTDCAAVPGGGEHRAATAVFGKVAATFSGGGNASTGPRGRPRAATTPSTLMTTGDTEYVDDQYAPLHLNHYVWRSEAECLLKAANKAAGVDQYGRRVDWRSTAEASCSHTSSNLPQDLRMAEQGGGDPPAHAQVVRRDERDDPERGDGAHAKTVGSVRFAGLVRWREGVGG